MRIILTNKTRFRDDDLRDIMRAACSRAGVAAGTVKFRVDIGKLHIRGRAYLPGSRKALRIGDVQMSIPRFEIWGHGRHGQRERTPEQLKIEVCQVALHEAMHLAGVRHVDMTEEQLVCKMPVPWADALQLRTKEEQQEEDPVAKKAAARADRLGHAQAMLAKAQTRSKRAETILKKWKRRVALLSQ